MNNNEERTPNPIAYGIGLVVGIILFFLVASLGIQWSVNGFIESLGGSKVGFPDATSITLFVYFVGLIWRVATFNKHEVK
jgi:hypothetical protein